METKLVTVIIPIYNVEKYIGECLQSIINQTYKNLEIICIDDCGIDNSIKIVENFAKKDERIKIIYNKKNSGASISRNNALRIATGDYIGFIDSDDFVDLDYFEKMLNEASMTGLDIVQNNSSFYYFNKNEISLMYKYKLKNIIFEINSNNIWLLSNNVWDKLYKREFLIQNNIFFPEDIIMGEDKYFNYNCVLHINNIKLFSGPNYYYRQNNDNSVMNVKKNNNDIINCLNYIYNLIILNKKENTISIPFIEVKSHLKYAKNKNDFMKKIQVFFLQIKTIVETNKNLYSNKELNFFYCILNSNNYFSFKIKFKLSKIFKINYAKQIN